MLLLALLHCICDQIDKVHCTCSILQVVRLMASQKLMRVIHAWHQVARMLAMHKRSLARHQAICFAEWLYQASKQASKKKAVKHQKELSTRRYICCDHLSTPSPSPCLLAVTCSSCLVPLGPSIAHVLLCCFAPYQTEFQVHRVKAMESYTESCSCHHLQEEDSGAGR